MTERMKAFKSWRLICLLTVALQLTGCSKGYDEGYEAISHYASDAFTLPRELNGEFAVNWIVDDEVVDTTRLQVEYTANVLSLPLDWLNRQIFQQEKVSVEIRDDESSKVWGLALRLTGYTDNSIYFDVTKSTYTQRVFVDNSPFDYYVYFATDKATAIYNKQWDAWTATIPIDSIQVADESIRVNHRPKVIDVIRFNPAKNLSFTSTKRTKN